LSDAAQMERTGRRATSIYALALLTLIYALNYTDRNIFSIVLQSMKQELVLTDTQIGLIGGFAFVLFYSILGVPIARLADRHDRRLIIGTGFAFWSLMTALTGLVTNVWQLAVCRFLMGAGEATGIAPSNSMVSDLFSKARRPLALAVLASGSSIGYFFGYMLGGWVNQLYGWRAAFLVAGIPGMIIALIFVLTVREPARTGHRPKSWDKETFWQALKFLAGSRCYIFTVIGCSLLSINVYAILVWNAAFLIRVHGFTSGEAGTALGLVRGAIGIVAIPLGGYLANRLGAIDQRWRVWVPALGVLLTLPADLLFLFAPQASFSVLGIALGTFFTGLQFGPVYALCQDVARPHMRAVSIALFLLCVNLVGQIIGPLVVGSLNDVLKPAYGDLAIRYSMLFGAFCALPAGNLILLGTPFYAADVKRAEVPGA
jgi:MFS family permease